MKKEKWNPEDWQGRSKKQIETNNAIMYYSVICLAVVGAFVYIIQSL